MSSSNFPELTGTCGRTRLFVSGHGSPAAVNIGSVLDPHHVDGAFLDQSVDDPVRATPPREVASQLTAERFADPTWVFTERPIAELPHREGNRHRQLSFEGTPSATG
jgi:hypothetical protein